MVTWQTKGLGKQSERYYLHRIDSVWTLTVKNIGDKIKTAND